ncbi:MAG: hypothetical protein ACKO0Z_20990 [Betaproteobacteria bacterium]
MSYSKSAAASKGNAFTAHLTGELKGLLRKENTNKQRGTRQTEVVEQYRRKGKDLSIIHGISDRADAMVAKFRAEAIARTSAKTKST